eukprot:COSAG01_NODE_7694_length_3095_cov_2.219553_4_plen_195_part_00
MISQARQSCLFLAFAYVVTSIIDLIVQKLAETIESECGPLAYQAELGNGWLNETDACRKALKNVSGEVGPHNLYNVDDFCPTMNPDAKFTLDDWTASMATNADGSVPRMDKLLHESPTAAADASSDEDMPVLGAYERWCGVDDAMMTWLMVPEVMKALNIRLDKKATEHNNLHYEGGSYPPYGLQTFLCAGIVN